MSLDGDVGEMLELVDAQNNLTGELMPRSKVHELGAYHRTVYVIAHNSKGEWLLQRRHNNKAVCGGCWDLSAAEHLNPKEAYEAAAVRGLREELGIDPEAVRMLKQVLPPSLHALDITTAAGKHIIDNEFVPLYQCEYEGPVNPDDVEVSEVRWVTEGSLLEEVKYERSTFTPWFVETLELLGKLKHQTASAV
mmetsp:Transcript_13935/g.29772  ORF Transcript_13935/g.29772 Transcript_13935/m.29772 type:complete len:193 (+) Transcript_13935:176-754(+)|eukprot:CAMPEP_0118951182 /NCGR_PEP_ID=MMETSP1169-20130426/52668_1 /TAXON_ID=36882 /ORGANISM="Pyramimonas obovata, Strain CCMP722" /LENGTH=192 /DNA_ID=CAMNT_0006898191 /DNA_START=99 /DNA_END=677 /DNA_ORIENTATION=+